jgi:Tol biopolymer transport system component
VAVVTDGHIWIHDLSGATSMRQLTFGGSNRHPVWSPDSERIAFQSDREGNAAIFWQRADGSDTPTRLTRPEKGRSHVPSSWSPDGGTLLYSEADGSTFTVWALSLRDLEAVPFGEVRSFSLPSAVFRPDGRWVAYRWSDKPDAPPSVVVQPFPSTGAKYRIASPGNHPMWSADGRELVYAQGPGLFFQTVSVATQPSFTFGNPVSIKRGTVRGRPDTREFDLLPDGKRFVELVDPDDAGAGTGGPEFVVVLNWHEELKQRVPIGR